MPSLVELVAKQRDIIARNSAEFHAIFGVPLHHFYEKGASIITGFDVVKFDEFIKTPDGTSTNDHITAVYGERALELVHSLIGR